CEMRCWNRGPAIGWAAILVALISPAVSAHDFWIEPATFHPQLGELVSISLREGDGFDGRPVPRDATRIAQFIARGAGGAQPIVGLDGRDPAGVARLSAPGMYVLGYQSNHAFTTMEAWRFEEHLIEKGLEKIAELRRKRGISNRSAREAYSRYSKALVHAGDPSGEAASRPLGFKLELIAEFDPYEMGSRREASFRLLFDGKPLEGALVTATSRDAPDSAMRARTDAEGRVKYRLRDTGAWLIAAVHMIEAPPGLGAEWESFWASLTFELPGNDSILALKQ
ncbi:MAG: DUF4198 domain-containing protein, partial [Steroidobacteraceae bacterium]